MVINYNDYVSCALDRPEETAFYRFQGTAGEKIQITISANKNWGPCFRLFDPTNTSIQEVCPSPPYGATVLTASFTLSKTGTYTIRTYDSGFNETFQYRM